MTAQGGEPMNKKRSLTIKTLEGRLLGEMAYKKKRGHFPNFVIQDQLQHTVQPKITVAPSH